MTEDDLSRQRIARGVAAAFLIVAGIWMLSRFVGALAWAVLIGLAVWPWYERLRERTSGRAGDIGAPLLCTLVVAAVVFVPLVYGLVEAGHEARVLAHWFAQLRGGGMPMPEWIGRLPLVGAAAADWWTNHVADQVQLEALIGQLDPEAAFGLGRRVGAVVVQRFVTLCFTVVTLFFMLRNGAELAERTLGIARNAFGEAGERYLLHIVAAIRATVNGLVLVGIGEGVLLGIAYAIAGIPHPALLGLVTGVTAMIPFAAPIVFGLASVFVLAAGHSAAAIALFCFGSAVLFVADHFIRPALIGEAVSLPFLWVLLGILGGLETIGLIGLFVGPALMAALMSIWRDASTRID